MVKLKFNKYALLYAAVFVMVLAYSFTDSNYLIWADAGAEYALYLKILNSGEWFPTHGVLNSSIITTLLPAKLQPFSGLSTVVFFKIYIAALVSFLPPAVYLLAKSYGLRKLSIIAAFFVIVQFHFARAPLFARFDISLAAWCLMLICLREKVRYRYILVTVSGLVMVISYYAVAFLAVFVLGFLALFERRWTVLTGLCLTAGASFLWHGIITKTAGVTLAATLRQAIERTVEGATPIYDTGAGDFWHMGISVDWSAPFEVFGFLSFWLAIAVVVLGIISYRRDILLSLICAIPMLAVYGFPYLESAYGFIRFYFFAVIAFSPFFVYGLRYLWLKHPAFAVAVGFMILAGYATNDAAQAYWIGFVLFVSAWVGINHLAKQPVSS